MIARIRVACAYEVGRYSKAQVRFLDGRHAGKMADCQILAPVANGDILLGEYDFTPDPVQCRGVFIPLKDREVQS